MAANSSQDLELLTQYASLRLPGHVPRGLHLAIVPHRRRRWQGLLFLHKGSYAGAIFQFILKLDEYPDELPQVVFLGDVWHPLINKQGKLNLSAALRILELQSSGKEVSTVGDSTMHSTNASPDVNGHQSRNSLTDVLFAIKASFKTAVLEQMTEMDAYDIDAFYAYQQPEGLFAQLARQCVQASMSKAVLYREHLSLDLPVHLIDPAETGAAVDEDSYEISMAIAKKYLKLAHQAQLTAQDS